MYYSKNDESFIRPRVTEHETHMVMTDVVRVRKIKYVNFDTRFLQNLNSLESIMESSIYNVQLVEALRDVTSVQVVQMEVPVSFHTLSERLGNNNFSITNTATKVVTIYLVPDCYYNFEYISELVATLNAVSSAYLFSATKGGLMTIENRSGAPMTVDFGLGSSSLDSLGWLLGFRKQKYVALSITPTFMSECAIDFNPVRYLYLCMEDYSTSSSTDFVSYLAHSIVAKKIASRITVGNSRYGSMLFNSPSTAVSNVRVFPNSINLTKIAFQLTTENGTIVDMNGLSYSFVLKVEHE
jgi:hypothetical protein